MVGISLLLGVIISISHMKQNEGFQGPAQSHKAKMAEQGFESKLSKVESVFRLRALPLSLRQHTERGCDSLGAPGFPLR